jgi:serine/threonine-protein kinase
MQTSPPTPTSLIDRLDPVIEQTILACLKPRPEQRPATPLQIAAMLPGGDPLQAALAAGETPSPDVVAAAAAEGSISPLVGAALLGAVVVLTVLVVGLGSRVKLHRQIPLPLSPEQLSLRAEQVLTLAGADTSDRQRIYGWSFDEALLRAWQSKKRSPDDWSVIRRQMISGVAPPMLFWHQSSGAFEIHDQLRPGPRTIPLTRPGDTWVNLDPAGRIRELEIIPPAASSPAGEVDWRPLLAQTIAGGRSLVSDTPRWRSPITSDRAQAWKTTDQAVPVRIEAASAGGKPVWMAVLGPEEVPYHATVIEPPLGERVFLWVLIAFYVIAIITGSVLAWRNARSGRGDRRGAFRIAAVIFTAGLLSWVLGGFHVPSVYEIGLLAQALMEALFSGALVWLLYMALEPIIRRVWPQRLISWNRVLIGAWRDPMVGRDMLVGAGAGLLMTLGNFAEAYVAASRLGRNYDIEGIIFTTLEGNRGVLFTLLQETIRGSVLVPFASLTFIVLIGLVVRRMNVAAVIFWLLFTAAISFENPNEPVLWLISAITTSAFTFALVRFGLLAAVTANAVFFFTYLYPITADPGAWFFPVSCAMLLLIAAVASYGFLTSIGPRQAWISEEALR